MRLAIAFGIYLNEFEMRDPRFHFNLAFAELPRVHGLLNRFAHRYQVQQYRTPLGHL